MKSITLLSILFITVHLHVQGQSDTVFIKRIADQDNAVLQYKTDTILFDSSAKSKILYGTMVLPDTYNQIFAMGMGLSLDSVSISECKTGVEDAKDNSITRIEKGKTLLNIQTHIYGNCCHSFLCDVQILDQKTINLITYGYGIYCACICTYNLTFHFSVSEPDRYAQFEDVIINNVPETMKRLE